MKGWLNRLVLRRSTLAVIIALVISISHVVTSRISYNNSITMMKESIQRRELPAISHSMYARIKSELFPMILVSKSMAQDPYVYDFLTQGETGKEEFLNFLKKTRQGHGFLTSFFASEATNIYYLPEKWYQFPEEDSKNKSAQWYYDFRNSGKEYALNFTIHIDMNNISTVFINYRFEDGNGNFLGVIGIGIELNAVREILGRFQKDNGRNLYFVKSDGTIIVHSRKASLDQDNIYQLNEIEKTVGNPLSKELFFFEYHNHGKKFLGNARYISELDCWMFLEQEEESAIYPVKKSLFLVSLINGLSIIVTSALLIISVGLFQKKINDLAIKDTLTGLYNRRMIEDQLSRLFKQTSRSEVTFSIMLLDIDNFKKINDSYGHLEGDRVLKEISRLLTETIRSADFLCRWGGEEFFLIAYQCHLNSALDLAEKIRSKVEEASIVKMPESQKAMTISIGVTSLGKGDDEDSLITRADEALYRAKENGRNQVQSC